MASLLGTGVMLTEGLGVDRELVFVLSFRYLGVCTCLDDVATRTDGEEAGPFALDDFAFAGVAALEKKPRMLCCCLPVEGAWPDFLAADDALAGVRAVVDRSLMICDSRGL